MLTYLSLYIVAVYLFKFLVLLFLSLPSVLVI